MNTIYLANDFRDHLQEAFLGLPWSPYEDPKRSLRTAGQIMMFVSSWARSLAGVDDVLSTEGPHICRIRNAPLDPVLCPTPSDGLSPATGKQTFVSEFFLMGLAGILGLCPFGYEDEKGGAFLHQVTPMPGKEETISSNGSGAFGLHTEGPHSEFPAEFFFLSCLRGHPQAMSPLVALDDVLPFLDQTTFDVLQEPEFEFTPGASYANKRPVQLPVIYTEGEGGEEVPLIRYHAHNLEATTERAAEALVRLEIAINKAQVWSVLHPGDVVIFDNRKVLHGRTGFPVTYDGNQRWLQRCYLTRDFASGPVVDADRLVWKSQN